MGAAIPGLLKLLLWGVVLLASFVGWGRLVQRVLDGRQRQPWGVAAALGVAVVVVLGGVLNLFSLATGPVLAAMLLAGVLSAIVSLRLPAGMVGGKVTRLDRIGWWISSALVIFVYFASLQTREANPDDCTGYFPLAENLLQTGTVNHQSFSERRMVSLGGDILLHGAVGIGASYANMGMIEPGGALVIFAGVTWALGRRNGTRGIVAAALPAFLAITPLPGANTTSNVMLIAMMVALAYCLQTALDAEAKVTRWIEAALLTGGLICLKSTVLPVLVIVWIAIAAWVLAHSPTGRTLVELVTAFGVVAAAMQPWMISLRISSGTPLFPLLGRGFHHIAFVRWEFGWLMGVLGQSAFDTYVRLTLLAGAMWICLRAWRAGSAADVAMIFAIASLIGSRAIAVGLGGYLIYRYQFPYLFAAFSAMILVLCGGSFRGVWGRAVAVVLILAMAVSSAKVTRGLGWQLPEYAKSCLRLVSGAGPRVEFDGGERVETENQVDPAGAREAYSRVQSHLEAGATVLLVTAHGYFWDFKRNPTLIADSVGTVSPPPGMPLNDADELVSYLSAGGLRYVVATGIYIVHVARLADDPKSQTPIFTDYFERVSRFQKEVHQLAPRYAIYDRDGFLVLDLKRNRSGPSSRPTEGTYRSQTGGF